MPDSTPEQPTKKCSKCGFECPLEKAVEYFPRRKNSPDGFRTNCKRCEAQRQATYFQKNKEIRTEKHRVYRESHKQGLKEYFARYRQEHLEERRLKDRQRYQSSKAERKAYNRKYYLSHREQIIKQVRAYEKTHRKPRVLTFKQRLIRKAINQKYRARKSGLPNVFTSLDWQYCLDYWHGCCAYCGKQANGLWSPIHAEHFIPLSAANCPGTVRENMLPACEVCNHSKNNKDPETWLIERFGKRKAAQILKRIQGYFDTFG